MGFQVEMQVAEGKIEVKVTHPAGFVLTEETFESLEAAWEEVYWELKVEKAMYQAHRAEMGGRLATRVAQNILAL